MMRPIAALVTVLPALLVACAELSRETPSPLPAAPTRAGLNRVHPMPPAVPNAALLAGARDAADRVLRFLSEAQSSNDFSAAQVGQCMGFTLTPDPSDGEEWMA
jgi:hypothetical protein